MQVIVHDETPLWCSSSSCTGPWLGPAAETIDPPRAGVMTATFASRVDTVHHPARSPATQLPSGGRLADPRSFTVEALQ
jgi:hypothetical protein